MQAKSLTNFLTNMVAFSSGKDGVLPGGYVPLPSALATQATADIAKDIVGRHSDPSGPSGSGTWRLVHRIRQRVGVERDLRADRQRIDHSAVSRRNRRSASV